MAYGDMKEWQNREERMARDITDEIELDEINTYVKRNLPKQSYGLLIAENIPSTSLRYHIVGY